MKATLGVRMRVLILTILLALGLTSYIAFRWLANLEQERRVRQNMSDTTAVISRFIRENRHQLALQVRLVSSLPTLKNSIMTGDSLTLQAALRDYLPVIEADSMAVVDDLGSIVAATNAWPKGLADVRRHPGVIAALEGRPWQRVEAIQGNLYIVVVAPTQLSEQGWYGAVMGVKHVNSSVAHDLQFNDALLVAFTEGRRVLAAGRTVESEFVPKKDVQQFIESGGKVYVGQYEQLPETDQSQNLGFLALQNYEELSSFYHNTVSTFFAVLVPMMLLGLVLGERFTRSLAKPLEEVVKAAAEMRRGQKPKPFEVGRRRDEVGVLQTVFNDMVAAVEENQKLLLGMIDTDPLTGLGNHRSFHDHLKQQIKTSRESGANLAMLLIDIDRFHDYNLANGHAAGDAQLKAYAGLMRATCPGNAILARYGGDQFAILLPKLNADEAERIALRIREAAGQNQALIATSIGVAEMSPTASNEEGLVLSAELALSRAKQLGRNRVSRFDSELASDTPGSSELIEQYLLDGSLATVQALAAAVDAKDQYTKGHSERVAALARDLAEYMKCAPAFVELVYRAGTLHDVGKIGVPDAILSKPGRLTAEELSVMETHPVLGEVIVAKVPALAMLLPGVRSHHERWDGRGYPDGLAGEEIPTLARYLAVADTFDAMTSDRPYREALSVDVALGEIQKCAGTQFDPELAVAFVKMMRERLPVTTTSARS